MTETANQTEKQIAKQIGRNEPCPCKSGKKYKRCCGVDAAPKLSERKAMPGLPEGFDPSQINPEWMGQFTQALQRMPQGQMQKLQSIMQRAMSGKDVSKDAEELERLLPPELQSLMMNAPDALKNMIPQGADMGAPEGEMTEEEAKRLVAEAAKAGDITPEKAAELLEGNPVEEMQSESGGLSKLWKKLGGNKSS